MDSNISRDIFYQTSGQRPNSDNHIHPGIQKILFERFMHFDPILSQLKNIPKKKNFSGSIALSQIGKQCTDRSW